MRANRTMLWALCVAWVGFVGCKTRPTLETPLDLEAEAPSAVPRPEPFVEALPAAISGADYEGLRPLCTVEYAADPDGCHGTWEQANRKGFTLVPTDRQVVVRGDEGRMVLSLDVVVGGRTVDRIFAYAVADAKGWRLGGIDEIREHAAPFLEGLIGAHIDVGAMPADPALDGLGARLIIAAAKLEGDPERILRGGRDVVVTLGARERPRFVGSHVHERLGRAVLEFTADDEPVYGVYLARRDGVWSVREHGFGVLSARSLLRAR
jgi:hypothetical protein